MDQYRTKSNIDFIVSGSMYSLMIRIFQDRGEPLFDRADAMMRIMPFTTVVLKQILQENKPGDTNDELLAF